jgi:hypothetical protein
MSSPVLAIAEAHATEVGIWPLLSAPSLFSMAVEKRQGDDRMVIALTLSQDPTEP